MQKAYTNQLLFDTEDIIILPFKCWKFLSNIYGGVFIERYTILNTSNLIETEVELQKIMIRIKGEPKVESFIQMSRISFWKDLEAKIIRILGYGKVTKQVANKTQAI